nr:MAG TPA: hypothetical protein [Caudoviricetes sp.]
MLLAGCVSQRTVTLYKPALPIFSLNKSDSQITKLNAYKDSLDLMIIYSNDLEKIIHKDHDIEYNLVNYTGKEYGKRSNKKQK